MKGMVSGQALNSALSTSLDVPFWSRVFFGTRSFQGRASCWNVSRCAVFSPPKLALVTHAVFRLGLVVEIEQALVFSTRLCGTTRPLSVHRTALFLLLVSLRRGRYRDSSGFACVDVSTFSVTGARQRKKATPTSTAPLSRGPLLCGCERRSQRGFTCLLWRCRPDAVGRKVAVTHVGSCASDCHSPCPVLHL